jgi:hypothetical protein
MLWFLKLTSPLVLVIREDGVSAAKGRIPAATLRQLHDVLADTGVRSGTIHANGAGRYCFSRHIPEAIHQRLRNILVSP